MPKDKGRSGSGDWLGTGRIATQLREYRPFKKARAFARALKLMSFDQWLEYAKSGEKPVDIPAAPHLKYKDEGWKGMGDWLDKK